MSALKLLSVSPGVLARRGAGHQVGAKGGSRPRLESLPGRRFEPGAPFLALARPRIGGRGRAPPGQGRPLGESPREVAGRERRQAGHRTSERVCRRPPWLQLSIRALPRVGSLSNVTNPLVLLLTALGVLSFLTGDLRATVVIFVMVVLGVVLRFFQEMRADNAAEKLKAMVVGFVTSFGAHVVTVNLPTYAQALGVGLAMIGLLIAVYDFAEIAANTPLRPAGSATRLPVAPGTSLRRPLALLDVITFTHQADRHAMCAHSMARTVRPASTRAAHRSSPTTWATWSGASALHPRDDDCVGGAAAVMESSALAAQLAPSLDRGPSCRSTATTGPCRPSR